MATWTVSSGFESVQGRRWNMEDAHVVVDDLNSVFPELSKDVRRAFYAVFDGHGGKKCSLFLEKTLLNAIVKAPGFSDSSDIEGAIRKGCADVDAQIRAKSQEENWTTTGSTAVFAFLIDNILWAGNVGDSESILGKKKTGGSSTNNQLLSELHRPSKDEKKRLLAAGATLTSSKKVANPYGGDLAVSRAFGDCDYKTPLNHVDVDWVLSEPYVLRVELQPQVDEFLLLACDGLWDHLSKIEASDIIAKHKKSGKDSLEVADILVKLSLDRGSTDNITCIVVYLNWS